MKPQLLRADWFVRDIDQTVKLKAPGIYEWRIEGIGVYIGKASKVRSRIAAYPRNVRDILIGRPWHGNPAKNFRPIHHALHRAYVEQREVRVTVLESCSRTLLLERERFWKAVRRQEAAAGGLPVLNSN